MSERIHVLAQQILGNASLDECDVQEIKDLVNRYPYFAPGQFLLLEKLKKENSPDYKAQLQKTVLYYHDPLQFEYFISSDRFETEVDFEDGSAPLEIVGEDKQLIEIAQPEISETLIGETLLPEQEAAEDIAPTEELPHSDELAESIQQVLQQEGEQVKDPTTLNEATPVFEPYHTVDYFASQGIKLSQEEVSKDKFGKQLKSFTEWLKTMKRLPAREIAKNIDLATESKVQHLAEDSVHQADIITEAMAEVWIKQGNREKAIETYNKLSLLNPSKKAYFAALIDNLKRS